MKRGILLLAFAVHFHAQAKVIVIEKSVPELPKMEPMMEAAPLPREWRSRSLREVLDALKAAQKAGNVTEIATARDWLATNRKKDGDLWEAAAAQARAGKTEWAMRWLQEAARHEACDIGDVESDGDFAALIKHPQWTAVRKDLQECAAKWRASSYSRIVLTLPEKHVAGKELPLVVGMHGFGSLPEDIVGDDIQKVCDDLGVAFVSVSGRGVMARNSFEWTSDFSADADHVFSSMDAVKEHVGEKRGACSVIGFSQGAQMALQLLALHPQRFCGAVAMSPGSRHASRVSEVLTGEQTMSGKTIFLSWISGEGSGMAQRCRAHAELFRKSGAKAVAQEFAGAGHEWPRGYAEFFSLALQVMR
jgi:predicted esterase